MYLSKGELFDFSATLNLFELISFLQRNTLNHNCAMQKFHHRISSRSQMYRKTVNHQGKWR